MPFDFKFQSISPQQVGILGRKTNAGSSGPDLWSKLSLTSTLVVPPGGIFSSTQEGPWRRIVSTMNRAFNRKKGKQIQPTNVWANKRSLFLAGVEFALYFYIWEGNFCHISLMHQGTFSPSLLWRKLVVSRLLLQLNPDLTDKVELKNRRCNFWNDKNLRV